MAANSDSAPSSSSQSSSLKPEEDAQKHSQVLLFRPSIPSFSSPLLPAEGTNIASPTMYPILVPCFAMQNQEHVGRGAGIYAVQTLPFADRSSGVPSCTLIPLTYSTPTSSATDTGVASGEQGQTTQQQQQQQLLQAQQLGGPQRQIVVRRFQIAFQLDLLLILKLAAVIFLFNQDGSRQRLALLVFLAALVYLYQTGALTPLIRWVSRAMHNAASPPRPARPAARAEPPQRPGNENAAAFPEGQQGENDQPAADEDVNRATAEDEAVPEAAEANGADNNQWWGIVKEVQMIVFGFITSLLPGFHHHMD